MKVLVHPFSVDEPLVSELATIENLSPQGVRVATERPLNPGSLVVVKSSSDDLWARARVVYCQPISPKGYAVGLDLFVRTNDWIMRSKSWQLSEMKK